jgi:hypothetical protein
LKPRSKGEAEQLEANGASSNSTQAEARRSRRSPDHHV